MYRQHILDEIRRTAQQNGGIALGSRRFREATGIRPVDWEGKYWARWGDAVREAGFEANKLRSSYDRDYLFEQYISLTRKLGRLPVKRELLLETRRTPGFPNEKTFARTMGRTKERLDTLRAYCSERGYEEVLTLLPAHEDLQPASPLHKDNEVNIGAVYLIKFGRNYKIGYSNSVGRREYEIALQLPEKETLVHAIRTDDPAGIEQYWHRRFVARRGNGEWFALTAEDVTAFRRRKFM